MSPAVCSLVREATQSVPADGEYHVLRFPFGERESYDEHEMHQVRQPDGHVVDDWDGEDRSGLIWPSVEGWGTLTAMVQWEKGGYRELRDQFVRDPLGLTDAPVDTTGTSHRAPTPGIQCFTAHHELFVYPGVPLALRVAHDDSTPRKVIHAQFKLAIH